MRKMVCEICGESHLLKKDGVFECQNCGTRYTLEEAKKLFFGSEDLPKDGSVPSNNNDVKKEEIAPKPEALTRSQEDNKNKPVANITSYSKPEVVANEVCEGITINESLKTLMLDLPSTGVSQDDMRTHFIEELTKANLCKNDPRFEVSNDVFISEGYQEVFQYSQTVMGKLYFEEDSAGNLIKIQVSALSKKYNPADDDGFIYIGDVPEKYNQYIKYLVDEGIFDGLLSPMVSIFYGNVKRVSQQYYKKVSTMTDVKPEFSLFWLRHLKENFLSTVQKEIRTYVQEGKRAVPAITTTDEKKSAPKKETENEQSKLNLAISENIICHGIKINESLKSQMLLLLCSGSTQDVNRNRLISELIVSNRCKQDPRYNVTDEFFISRGYQSVYKYSQLVKGKLEYTKVDGKVTDISVLACYTPFDVQHKGTEKYVEIGNVSDEYLQYIAYLDDQGVFSGILNPAVMIFYGNRKYCSPKNNKNVSIQTDDKPMFYLYWTRDTGSDGFVQSLEKEIDKFFKEPLSTQQSVVNEVTEKPKDSTQSFNAKPINDANVSSSTAKNSALDPSVVANDTDYKKNKQIIVTVDAGDKGDKQKELVKKEQNTNREKEKSLNIAAVQTDTSQSFSKAEENSIKAFWGKPYIIA